MSVIVQTVEFGSIGYKKGIKAGEKIEYINNNVINDVLDYDFYNTERILKMVVTNEKGKTREIKIKKDEYEQLGLGFKTYLMDKQHCCTNKCIFCFVDQLPKGMRKSLYFKDDDDRLSFLFGNYITMTNMKEHELDRIIKMKISPINISVHTTNPQLREKMLKNRFAGSTLKYIDKLAEANIKLNTQLVICPNINDGDELIKSLHDLAKLYPSVQSIACVPLGITRYRDGLEPLEPFTTKTALETVRLIEEISDYYAKVHGERIIYPADEFYIKADIPVREYEFYEEFLQLENGIGMLSLLENEFDGALNNCDIVDVSTEKRTVTIATGVDAYPYIKKLAQKAMQKFTHLECNVVAIVNNYFGETITVTGLITATDLLDQLKEVNLGEQLLLSSSMIKDGEDMFLDNITIEQLEDELKINITLCDNDGYDLLDKMLDIKY